MTEKDPQKGEEVRNMRKIAALLLAAVLCCLTGAETEYVPKAYEPVLEMIRKGVAGDRDVLRNEDFNSAIYMENLYGEQMAGWALLDLDGDEEEELLIGRTDWQPEEKMLWIFDIWTTADGKAARIARGGERSRIYLTREVGNSYGLYLEGSRSASENIFEHYLIREGRLTNRKTINAFTDRASNKTGWTMNETGIEEERAAEKIEKWKNAICPVRMMPLE